ncbi:MAG: O-antigen biosynthesis protein [Legionella sp. 40-6]|nr:O-antigen ligase family protein [Legionella sp.]OJX88994.1 MAG: O-antigen biosynthesis protein [Legionella sp. 40-6]
MIDGIKEKGMIIAPFLILMFTFFIPISSSVKSVMGVACLIAIVLTPQYRKLSVSNFTSFWGCAILVFFAYVVLASFWADSPFAYRISVIDKYAKILYLPLLATVFINPTTRRWTFNLFIAAMLLTCLLSFIKHYNLILLNNMEDSGEVFHNHIATGYMVALATYFAGILFLTANTTQVERIYYGLMIVVGSYQIFFLNTGRTGYVIYLVLMCFLLIQKLPLKRAFIGCSLLFATVGIVYVASPLMQVRTAALISDIKFLQQHEENTSLGFRVQFHDYARSLFEKNPLFGLGTGTFKYHFGLDQPVPAWDRKLNDPHSQYWLTLVELGVVGMGLFLFFIFSLFVTALKLEENKPVVLGILLAFILGCFTDSILCYSTAGMLMIVFTALGFGELIEKRHSLREKEKMLVNPEVSMAI